MASIAVAISTIKRLRTINSERLKEHALIKFIFTESKGSAGARMMAQIATDRGRPLSRYRAGRLMKACHLRSCQQPKHMSCKGNYKRAAKEHIAIPNHLNRAFNVTKPNEVWCGDVTYIWTGQGSAGLIWPSLWTCSQESLSVGHYHRHQNSQLTADALKMAFESYWLGVNAHSGNKQKSFTLVQNRCSLSPEYA